MEISHLHANHHTKAIARERLKKLSNVNPTGATRGSFKYRDEPMSVIYITSIRDIYSRCDVRTETHEDNLDFTKSPVSTRDVPTSSYDDLS